MFRFLSVGGNVLILRHAPYIFTNHPSRRKLPNRDHLAIVIRDQINRTKLVHFDCLYLK
jgi:hypothetical protein